METGSSLRFKRPTARAVQVIRFSVQLPGSPVAKSLNRLMASGVGGILRACSLAPFESSFLPAW